MKVEKILSDYDVRITISKEEANLLVDVLSKVTFKKVVEDWNLSPAHNTVQNELHMSLHNVSRNP